jgi:4'-phosphopantetheinyl transferase EntD
MIERLFPEAVITVTSDTVEHELLGLLPEELSQIHRAVEKRQQEYAAGRQCARAALRRLGIHGFALVNDADRVPMWPPEIVGSVTHCDDFCGVAVARRHPILGLGVDAEPIDRTEPALHEIVCVETEQAAIERAGNGERDFLFKALFSAKESFYKAVFPLFRIPLEFHEVEIQLGDNGQFLPRVLVALPSGFERLKAQGRIVATHRHVFTGVTLSE